MMMNDILSIWHSPLDKVAVRQAEALGHRQPRCTVYYDEDFSPMTVFNFGYYIVESGSMPDPDYALYEMFSAMQTGEYGASGGTAFIPQQSFTIDSNYMGEPYAVPDQCTIIGSGGGGALPAGGSGSAFYHFVVNPNDESGATTFLDCSPATHTSGGIYFRSLAFLWGSSTQAKDRCIYAGAWNTRAINCTFTNCPVAFHADALNCVMEQCTINYNVTDGPDSTTAVILSHPEASGRRQTTRRARSSCGFA